MGVDGCQALGARLGYQEVAIRQLGKPLRQTQAFGYAGQFTRGRVEAAQDAAHLRQIDHAVTRPDHLHGALQPVEDVDALAKISPRQPQQLAGAHFADQDTAIIQLNGRRRGIELMDHRQRAVVGAADQLQCAGREAGDQQALFAEADIDRVLGVGTVGPA